MSFITRSPKKKTWMNHITVGRGEGVNFEDRFIVDTTVYNFDVFHFNIGATALQNFF